MPNRPKQPRRVANVARPAADAACRKARTVTRQNLQVDVWSCSAPRGGVPLERPPRVNVAPEIVKVGRRNWRLFFVSTADLQRGDARMPTVGWYFEAARANPAWGINQPEGPYATFDKALNDLVVGHKSGWWG